MYCSQCGAQTNESSDYCVKCGAKLSVGTSESYGTVGADFEEGQERTKTRDPGYVRPWVRYFARYTDGFLVTICLIVGAEFMWPTVLADLWDRNPPLSSMGILAVMVVIEPWFLSKWGATPGKALFRIQILALDTGRKLSYLAALRRALLVWFRGIAMGLPVFSLIAQIVAYRRLKVHGVASWDRDSSSVVTHAEIGGGRIFLIILIWLAFLGLAVLSSLPEAFWIQLDVSY